MAFISRLFQALSRTRRSISDAFTAIQNRTVDLNTLDDLEANLIAADMGVSTVDSILDVVRKNAGGDYVAAVDQHLKSLLPDDPKEDSLKLPAVLMVVGVNGTGKTTSAAKLAHYYISQGKKVLLIGADTYRAAAVEQLNIWARRIGVRLVCNEKSQEPSAVIFDGLTAGQTMNAEVTIVDTAGRLHTYENLMQELEKMYRVVQNRFPDFSLQSLITIDAGLGQNSLHQAREFSRRVHLDGAILTKMDGTAKGGIVFPLYSELAIPVRYIGLGEDLEDLALFRKGDYIHSLLGDRDV